MDDQQILDACSAILASLGREKPWMTAAGLARRIEREQGSAPDFEDIQRVLMAHARDPGRSIRYSSYPGRKSLDILWGHLEVVGERRRLAELQRIDTPDPAHRLEAPRGAHTFFISHNFRDFDSVMQLRELLARKGFGGWLFEADIPENGLIAQEVQQAIRDCEYFLAYVTRRSIGSLWVRKEIEQVISSDKPAWLVIDGRDEALLELFGEWTGAWPPPGERYASICESFAAELDLAGRGATAWRNHCEDFLLSLHECIDNQGGVLLYPEPPDGGWRGASLQARGFAEFLDNTA